MNLQFSGLILAGLTFFTIGIGHVLVRKLNYDYGTRPAPVILVLGALFIGGSLFSQDNLLSAALGILGLTTLWDGYEFYRQEERIRKGHAPANPNRPVES
ncbi:MAG: DUF4491 family protein [Anaerolineae bacterium]|nr:DUF4491 family protein [Anaerolineae bacterium]